MGTEIDRVDEFEALLAERSQAGSSKRDAWSKLSGLFEHFKYEPTEELAKAIDQNMAVYALRDRQYRAACDAVNGSMKPPANITEEQTHDDDF